MFVLYTQREVKLISAKQLTVFHEMHYAYIYLYMFFSLIMIRLESTKVTDVE